MFLKTDIEQYLLELASGEPVPGGGSVAALVGSLGGALASMVANISFPKKSFKELAPDIKDKMVADHKRMEELIEELKVIIDEDSIAFRSALEAMKLPKDTEEEKKIRAARLEEGYKEALEVPLRCANLSFEVLELMDIFSKYGDISLITDVGIGVLLSYSAVESSIINVMINLKYIKDKEYKETITKEIDRLARESKTLKESLLKEVYEKLN